VTRLSLLLLLALMASGLYLVRTTYESRRLFADIEKAKTEERQLADDAKRLDAERQAQATNLRVERVARDKLAMRMATPDVTRYVTDGHAPAAAGDASAPGGQPWAT
jgi:cell division protein FtsL